MYRKFLNARSPLRLLEKGLHGGLGAGNVGLVLAGHGTGKTAFLVSVALDDLLRGGRVLHVSLDQTVSHVRAYYDTVFEDLASSTHLEDEARVHADVDRLRTIRAYSAEGFGPDRLREAIALEQEGAGTPELVVVEGCDFDEVSRDDVKAFSEIASEFGGELWFSHAVPGEGTDTIPDSLRDHIDLIEVVLSLVPGTETVGLRCLKDHDNPDTSALHVHLDPKTLLLARG